MSPVGELTALPTADELHEFIASTESSPTKEGAPPTAAPRVSVVLSAKNEERFLALALDSIASQTFQDWECLIFDDGSTDRTAAIAASFAASDDRFRIFSSASSMGLAPRLNQLVLRSRGEYIARMDADDVMAPDRLERQVRALDALPEMERKSTVLGGGVVLIDAGGKELGTRTPPPAPSVNVRRFPPVLHPTIMASTEWFRAFPYEESDRFRRAEDSELWVRARRATTFRNLPEPVLRYRTISKLEPARFVKSQQAMIRIGRTHRMPTLVLRGVIGLVAGTVAQHSSGMLALAMRMRRILLGERLTRIIRIGRAAGAQLSGRLAVVASAFVAFDVGAFLHAQLRGPFVVGPPGALLFVAVSCIVAFAVGLPEAPRSGRQAIGVSLVSSCVTSIVLLLVLLLVAPGALPRFFTLLAPALEVPLLLIAWSYSRSDEARERRRTRVVVIASSAESEMLSADIVKCPERPSSLAGMISIDVENFDPSTVGARVREFDGNLVVVSLGAQQRSEIVEELRRLHADGVRVRTLVSFYETWLGRFPLGEVSAVALLVDHFDVHRVVYGRVKRAVDLIAGLAALVLAAMCVPVLVLGNQFGNSGPLIFRQTRVGRNGREFKVYKFRTMSIDTASEARVNSDVANDEARIGQGEWTCDGDPRVTSFGRLLRRFHLDELPQGLNLLRGDLSLVGPRPEQPRYVQQLSAVLPSYDARHGVRPGLTGWAQVKCHYASTEQEAALKLQHDLFYIAHQGPMIDLRTLGRTLRSVLVTGGR